MAQLTCLTARVATEQVPDLPLDGRLHPVLDGPWVRLRVVMMWISRDDDDSTQLRVYGEMRNIASFDLVGDR